MRAALRHLKHVADVRFSNVDKKSVDGQIAVELCNYTDVYYNDRITSGMSFMEATASTEQVAAFTLRSGDVLLTKDSETADDIGVSAYVAEDLPGVLCGYHLALARPHPTALDGRYLRWALVSTASRQQLELAASGVTRFGLRQDAVGGMDIPLPPLGLQRAIADYLDAETSRIDSVVEARNRQVQLLLGRLGAAIVGLLYGDARVSLVPLRRVVDLLPGYSYEGGAFLDAPGAFRLLRGINVDVWRLRWDDTEWVSDSTAAATHQFRLDAGDVVLGMDRPVISSGLRIARVTASDLPALLVQRVARMRARPGLRQDYLWQVLRTPALAAHFEPIFTGVSVPHVSPSQILEFEIPLPGQEQQAELVREIERADQWTTSLVQSLRQQVELLLERRQALITAAVTGQIDIPGVAACGGD